MTLFGKIEEQEIGMIKQVITELLKNIEDMKAKQIEFQKSIEEKINNLESKMNSSDERIVCLEKNVEDVIYKEDVLRTNFIKMSDILVNVAQRLKIIPQEIERDEPLEQLFDTKDNLEKEVPAVKTTPREQIFNLLPEDTKSVQDAIKKQSNANIRCLKCKRDVLAKNVRIEKKEETKYSVGECPICGRTVAKLVGRD